MAIQTARPNKRCQRRGAVVVLVAVSLTAIFCLAALSIDAGRMYRQRRQVQSAADLAADAAAIQLFADYAKYGGKDSKGTARATALEVASNNGYGNSQVQVNIPPASGRFAGKNGFAEVIVTFPVSRSVSRIMGSGDLVVSARAVAAGTWTPSKASVLVLDPKRKDSLKLKGKNSVLEVAGDIIVNSTDKRAVKVDKKAQLRAENLLVAGGLDKKVKGLIDADVTTNVEPTLDPLADLPTPSKGLLQDVKFYKSTSDGRDTYDLQPGYYKELKFDKNDTVRMSPGVYYVEGEISFKQNSSLSGSQVMIYSAAKKGIKFNSEGTLALSPPKFGRYAGVVLFQDSSSKTKLEFKNDRDLNVSGIIYAPNSEVKFKNSDVELEEDWESESEDYSSEDDGGIAYQSAVGASIIARKLSIEKSSHIKLKGADISSSKPLLGLVE